MFDISVRLEELKKCCDKTEATLSVLKRVVESAHKAEGDLQASWEGAAADKQLARFQMWETNCLANIARLEKIHEVLLKSLDLYREADTKQVGLIRAFEVAVAGRTSESDTVALTSDAVNGIVACELALEGEMNSQRDRLAKVAGQLQGITMASNGDAVYQASRARSLIGKALDHTSSYQNMAQRYREYMEWVDKRLVELFLDTDPRIAQSITNPNPDAAVRFLGFLSNKDLMKRWLAGDLTPESRDALLRELGKRELVYDEKSIDHYGSRQHGPMWMWDKGSQEERDALARIIRKYDRYKGMSNDEISELLSKLNSEGCGYAALCNAIMHAYMGNPGEFERTFGFPMYRIDKDGNVVLNYELLLADLYCSQDNHNLVNGKDVYDPDEDKSSSGTNTTKQKYRLERYLDQHGVEANLEEQEFWDFNEHSQKDNEVKLKEITELIREKLDAGEQVYLRMHPHNMIDEDGNVNYSPGTGHAISVVEVTDDGRIALSSWGKKYYLNPDVVKGGSDIYVNSITIGSE